jgi:hypothetical protein
MEFLDEEEVENEGGIRGRPWGSDSIFNSKKNYDEVNK